MRRSRARSRNSAALRTGSNTDKSRSLCVKTLSSLENRFQKNLDGSEKGTDQRLSSLDKESGGVFHLLIFFVLARLAELL